MDGEERDKALGAVLHDAWAPSRGAGSRLRRAHAGWDGAPLRTLRSLWLAVLFPRNSRMNHFLVHRALPGKATLVFAKSRLRNLAKHRKQIVTQAPRHGPYLRSTCACAAAQEHQAKGTLLAIGVAIPFIPLIPVSYCFINRDAGDEGDGPLQVGESCLDLSSLWRAPRQSAKNPFFCPDLRRCHILVPLSGGNEAQSGRDGQASKPLWGCRQDAAKRLPHRVQGPNPLARSTSLVFVLSPFSVLTLCFTYPHYLPRFALGALIRPGGTISLAVPSFSLDHGTEPRSVWGACIPRLTPRKTHDRPV